MSVRGNTKLLTDTTLSTRARKCCANMGVYTVGDLGLVPLVDFVYLPNGGVKTEHEILRLLKKEFKDGVHRAGRYEDSVDNVPFFKRKEK